MNFDNFIERRIVDNGLHSLVLEISADEYMEYYEELNEDYAMNILYSYLEYRGDDGRPSDVKIEYDDEYDIVRIKAKIHYIGNDHTTYRM